MQIARKITLIAILVRVRPRTVSSWLRIDIFLRNNICPKIYKLNLYSLFIYRLLRTTLHSPIIPIQKYIKPNNRHPSNSVADHNANHYNLSQSHRIEQEYLWFLHSCIRTYLAILSFLNAVKWHSSSFLPFLLVAIQSKNTFIFMNLICY